MADLISTATLAERLDVTPATLCHWRKRGVGPDFIRHGRVYFYPSDLLDAYLERIGPILSREEDPERRFFANIHNPRPTPERKVMLEDCLEVLEALTAKVEGLEDRLAKAEKALINVARRRVIKRRAMSGLPV